MTKQKSDIENSKKKRKEKVRPSRIVSFLFSFLSQIFLFFRLSIKYDRSELRKHKNGCLIFYNHYSNRDHYFLAASLNYRRVNYVLTNYFYFNKKLVPVLNAIRAIKKEQFKPDLIAMRKMKRVLDNNGMIAIAPAGQVTIHGARPYVSDLVIKFIRMCQKDVIALQIRGAYLMYPKWRNSDYHIKCSITTKFVPVINQTEIATLSDEEIYERVLEALDINEYDDQLVLRRRLKGKGRAEGMHSVLVRCPKCGSLYTNYTHDNQIVCSHCHNSNTVDEYGFLSPSDGESIGYRTVYEWYLWQQNVLREQLIKEELTLELPVNLYRNIDRPNRMQLAGTGVIYYKDNHLYYDGYEKEVIIHKEFQLAKLTQLPYSPNDHFEVPDQAGTYKFIPTDNKLAVMTWVQTIAALTEIREEKYHA